MKKLIKNWCIPIILVSKINPYADYLKTQMKPRNRNCNEKMNDEEYRLNKDILDEIITSPRGSNGQSFRRSFIIWINLDFNSLK